MDTDYSDLSVSKKLLCILHDKKVYEKIAREFGIFETNLERVNYMYDLLKRYKFLPRLVKAEKNNSQSLTDRMDGNNSFQFNDSSHAIHAYTKAIAYAQSGTPELAKAFANRSSVLFKEGYYKDCLLDIERALENNYPENLMEKVLVRKRKCLEKVDEPSAAFPHFWEVPEIEDSKRNPNIECATDSVAIASNRWYGRHVVATKDIQIGEVIAVEDAYVKAPTPDRLVHCDNCCVMSYTLIPCKFCTGVLFCGEACRKIAFDTYHRFECTIIGSLNEINGELMIQLPMRILLKAFMTGEAHKDPPTDADFYKSDRFGEIRKLKTNIERRNLASQMSCAADVAIAYHLLQSFTDFFEVYNEPDFFKELLLDLVYICSCNTTQIREKTPLMFKVSALGVYSFGSLFNHSCRANVIFNFHGSKLVARACRTIKSGQQCFINYLPLEAQMAEPSGRDSILYTIYLFNCDCKSCLLGDAGDDEGETRMRSKIERKLRENFTQLLKAGMEGTEKEAIKHHIAQIVQKIKDFQAKEAAREDVMHVTQDLLETAFSYMGNVRRSFK